MKTLKKAVLIVLMLSLVLALCACGTDEERIDELLQGSWVCSTENYTRAYYFKDGSYGSALINLTGEHTWYGSYEITREGIEVTDNEGVTSVLEYSYKDGKLVLYFNDNVMRKAD